MDGHVVVGMLRDQAASFFFGVRIWFVKVGQFSINYFRGLGLRIMVRVWVRVWVRVRFRVGVRPYPNPNVT